MVKYGEIMFKTCLSYIASKKKSFESFRKLLENDDNLTFKYSENTKFFREFASRRSFFFKLL